MGTGEPITAWFPLRRHTFVAYKIRFTGLLRDNETICLVVQEKPLFTGLTTLSMSEDCIVIILFKRAYYQFVNSLGENWKCLSMCCAQKVS